MRVIGEVLNHNLGGQVKMKYVDVIDDVMDDYPEVDDYLLKAGTKVLPLMVVDGKIINRGIGLNYREILELLEEMGVLGVDQ